MRAAALALLLLAGCASDASLIDVLAGQRVDGDASHVLVRGFEDPASATPFAVAHCSRFKRSAQFDRRHGDALRFRCVQ